MDDAPPPLRLTVVQLSERLDAFVSEYLREKSPETAGTYRRTLNEFERYHAVRAARPSSRFAFVERGHEGGDEAVTLFVDGTALDCTGPDTAFARTLCAMPRVDAVPAGAPIDLLVTLLRQGSVGFEEGV